MDALSGRHTDGQSIYEKMLWLGNASQNNMHILSEASENGTYQKV